MWSAPNYRLADAYINNTVDERNKGQTSDPFPQSFKFNGNTLQGSDSDFKNLMQELLVQTDYGLEQHPQHETLTDKIDNENGKIQDMFDDNRREMLLKQRDQPMKDFGPKMEPINPYIPAYPVIPPRIMKRASSPFDSILTTTVLVVIGVILCFFFIRALFPVEKQAVEQSIPTVGNMNITDNDIITEPETMEN